MRTPVPTAVVLPGRGYGHDHPGMYYTRMALAHRGWRAHLVDWDGLGADPAQWPDSVAAIAAAAFDAVQPQLVIAKSLGSFAMPPAAQRGLPGVWLTPLLTRSPLAAAAARLPSHSLLVGGTADQSWDGEAARAGAAAGGYAVLELDGADHGFDVGTDPIASIAVLDRLVRAVVRLLDRLPVDHSAADADHPPDGSTAVSNR